ncbi:MAG: hypothetical protein HOP12_02960 [Candidatus Eisenbacteria bacterium]|uniref:PEP-CTERM sorting domain-containing protein n=1 Tax=Eiseniibacteriota bacterium TaxID=2212470 RepID=A0A849SNX6_UNCEI|nr:hypothetical protein [Candidatus Eisenbacteria bacterium]
MPLKTLLQRATVVRAFLLVTTMALAVSASVASAANVLGNPGFEIPATPAAPPEYFGAGASWTSFGGGIFTVSSAVVAPHTGNQSLKMFGGCCSGAFQQFPALPGQLWNGGVWMLNSGLDPMGGGQVAAVNIEWIQADGTSQSTIIPFISNGTFTAASTRNVWTLQTITGVAPADAAFARLVVITGDFLPGGPAGAPFYDDAFLEVSGPTPTRASTWGKVKSIYR